MENLSKELQAFSNANLNDPRDMISYQESDFFGVMNNSTRSRRPNEWGWGVDEAFVDGASNEQMRKWYEEAKPNYEGFDRPMIFGSPGSHPGNLQNFFIPTYQGLDIISDKDYYVQLPVDHLNIESIQFKKPTAECFDGSEYQSLLNESALTPMRFKPRRVGITLGYYAFYEKLAKAVLFETSLKDKAKDLIPRVYATSSIEPIDLKKINEPFYKSIKSKGGKKNKKNWR